MNNRWMTNLATDNVLSPARQKRLTFVGQNGIITVKEATIGDEKMIVYHGSNEIVPNPVLAKGRVDTDFGQGFYLTEDYEMACRWVSNKKGQAIINSYDLDFADLNVVKFNLTENWLNYISANRGYSKQQFDDKNVDIIIGPTADDKMFTTLSLYWNNMLSKEHTILFLNAAGLSNQIAIKTPTALQHLRFISYERLTPNEKNMYRHQATKNRSAALSKIDEIKKQLGNEFYSLDTPPEYTELKGDEEYER